jgi:hypothetical protein
MTAIMIPLECLTELELRKQLIRSLAWPRLPTLLAVYTYEKQVMLRDGHIGEKEGKRR